MDDISFGADYFVIIDAVSSKELQTAKCIFDNIRDYINQSEGHFDCKYSKCDTPSRLLSTLKGIHSYCQSTGNIPFIHIEGHGEREYLLLPNGMHLKWEEVFEWFRKINITSRNNLFFASGACESAFGYTAASIFQECPVYGMLAPAKIVTAGEVSDGFDMFYRNLILNGDFIEAAKSFSKNVGPNTFAMVFSQRLFKTAAYKYLTQSCMGAGKRNRIEELVTRAVSEKGVSPHDARKHIKKELKRPQAQTLRNYYKTFMMIDKYPGNSERFEMDFVRFEREVRNGQHRNLT